MQIWWCHLACYKPSQNSLSPTGQKPGFLLLYCVFWDLPACLPYLGPMFPTHYASTSTKHLQFNDARTYLSVFFYIISLLALSALPLVSLANPSFLFQYKYPSSLTPSTSPPGNAKCFLLHASQGTDHCICLPGLISTARRTFPYAKTPMAGPGYTDGVLSSPMGQLILTLYNNPKKAR